ncbi:MAG: hypothetical protein GY946_01545 [bacterium]|nr:hypothetical protein [bacterium]
MRGLSITLFVLGLMLLGTQTCRHVYVKWIEPQDSVLDDYKEPIEENIAASRDLDELTALYKAAHEKRRGHEATHPDIKVTKRADARVFEDERVLEAAIQRLERQQKHTFELWFYWLCGLASILLGLLAYRRFNRWLGMVGIITGFTEMSFWTSPLWRSSGPQGEFEHLLTLKLALSIVSMALLIALWLRANSSSAEPEPPGA